MILFALTLSKVSYVAAVREVSIVLSAYFGIVYLGEKHGRQKLLGAALIALRTMSRSRCRMLCNRLKARRFSADRIRTRALRALRERGW